MRVTTTDHRWQLGLVAAVLVVALGHAPAEAVPPPAATLVGPTGVITGTGHTFTWSAAEGATFYYLQVNDATASPRLTLWYPAAQACPGGSATCFVTVSTGFAAGAGIWWVQTWNPDGAGPWSAGMRFTIVFTPGAWGDAPLAADRFQLVLGGAAVLDKLTGLVWERTPRTTAAGSWAGAVANCPFIGSTGSVLGWRLPTIEELASLIDTSRTNPALPAGHPFSSGNANYWSATTLATATGNALGVDFAGGGVFNAGKPLNAIRWWCVRGGQTTQSAQ
jgi:hypothetical protein